MLFDDFICYRAKALAQAQPFEVHIHPHINVSDTRRNAGLCLQIVLICFVPFLILPTIHVDVSATFDEMNYENITTLGRIELPHSLHT